jgi:hypothetical protein
MQRRGNAIIIERKNKTIRVKSKVISNSRHVSSMKDINLMNNQG